MNYEIKVTADNYYRALLKILNFKLDLSDLEIDFICVLLNNKLGEITPETKEIIALSLNKDKYMINNYIKRLKEKSILVKNKDSRFGHFILNPYLLDALKDSTISFKVDIEEEVLA